MTRAPRRILALDIGGSKISAAAVSLHEDRATVDGVLTVATEAEQGGEAVLSRSVDLAHAVRESQEPVVPDGSSSDRRPMSGIAIASAGVIDTDHGTVTSATSLIPGWAGTDLAETFRGAFGLPTAALNDVHAHSLGEWTYGAGAGAGSMLLAAVGTGLGGALIEGSRLLVGARGMAGHLGHMVHPAAEDIECSCGRRGHIETVASGTGLAALYSRNRIDGDPPAGSGRDVAVLSDRGVAVAQETIRRSASALGEVLGSAANCVDPGRVVVSGSVADAGESWWQALREGFAATVMDPLRDMTPVPGTLGGRAPLIGAAVFADAVAGRSR